MNDPNTLNLSEKDIARFWSCVVKQDNGCWIWTGSMAVDKPRFFYRDDSIAARRLAYWLHDGTVYDAQHAKTSCGNPRCISPQHVVYTKGNDTSAITHISTNCTCTGRRCRTCREMLCILEFTTSGHTRGVCAECRCIGFREYKYDLKPGEYRQLLDSQNNKCAVCNAELNWPVVDHSHTTQQTRGILCQSCNSKVKGIDDPVWMAMVKPYLKKYNLPLIDVSLTLEG